MTDIRSDQMILCDDAPPQGWAQEMATVLSQGSLTGDQVAQIDERIVGLGHGVELAHLRTPLVTEPTLGAYKKQDANEGHLWLWLVVLIPQSDASRHLGWMAHLAAGLKDDASRQTLLEAHSAIAVEEALEDMLAVHTHRYRSVRSGDTSTIERKDADSSQKSQSDVDWKLVVAILKEETYVDDLLALFVEHDIRGATLLEARGMAEHLAAHMSLFAGFKSAFKAVGHSQVILSLVPNGRVREVLEMVKTAAGGMVTPGAGIAFALDVPMVVGLNKGE